MSLFQHIAVWSLRALALWAALELGANFYQEASARAEALAQINGHRAAMGHLAQRAEALEARENAAVNTLARSDQTAWRLDNAGGAAIETYAARQLRESLMGLGAEAPVVDGAQTQAGSLKQIRLSAHWREAAETAPSIFYALATQYPAFRVAALRVERAQGGSVLAEAEFVVLVREGDP